MREGAEFASAVAVALLLAAPAARAFNPLDPSNSYDYVVLTHDSLADYAQYYLYLHRSLRSCMVRLSEVQAAFPGGTTVDQVRSFVVYAYQSWHVAPTYLLLVGDADMVEPQYDLIPTFVAHNPYYSWDGIDWYANDGYYVGSAIPGQMKPIMHLGRIPARDTYQVNQTQIKITEYQLQREPANPVWLEKILMLVGDASINEFPGEPRNATYRTLNDQLRATELNAWDLAKITTYYADALFQAGQDRTAITRGAWNAGYGFVNALGNTQDLNWLVFMAYFNLPGVGVGTGNPTFTESLAETWYTPVVFANSCFTNWFHRGPQLCVGEDLLFGADAARGAVAVIGPTHLADMVETYALNRTFVHAMVTDGVRNIGRLYSTAKSKFITENQGHAVFADQYVLLGDPALDIKLGPLPSPTAYRSGIEIEDAPVLQDQVVAKTSDITLDNVRVVNEAPGVTPLVGERMLKISGHDAAGAPGSIEWKMQDMSLPITQNMILSFWLNVQSTPSGNGKLVIDGNTSIGRLKDRLDVFDQYGSQLDAKLRTATDPGWRFYYADLSPLRGATLQDLRIRYESLSPADSGAILTYVDNIRVERYESVESQELINHSFEEDVDGNGTPDFWTNLNGETTTLNGLRSDAFKSDWNYSIVVQDVYANGDGAKQVFTANVEAGMYTVQLRHYAPDPTSFRVRIRDLEVGTLLVDMSVNTSATWQTVNAPVGNPYYGVRPARFSLEVVPQDPLRPVYVDNVEMFPPVVVSVGGQSTPGEGQQRAHLLGVRPNPGRSGQAVRVDFELPQEAEVEIGIFDVTGRLLREIPARRLGAGAHWCDLTIGSRAFAGGSGLCFVRMSVDGKWMPGARKAVVLP